MVSVSNFEAWQRASTSFAGMAALVPRPVTLARDGVPERVMGAEVSPGYFHLLGVPPMIGRDFETADARATGPRSRSSATTSGRGDSAATRA